MITILKVNSCAHNTLCLNHADNNAAILPFPPGVKLSMTKYFQGSHNFSLSNSS